MKSEDALALVGRLFIALIFLASAFGKMTNFQGTVQYMEQHGVPRPDVLCLVAIVVETVGSVFLVLGYKTRWGAGLLSLFLLAATWIFHTNPDQRIQMLKNLAILGGLLHVMAFGAGGVSLEGGGRSA